jgi:xylulokinase
VAEELGPAARHPVAAGGGDNAAAAVGTGIVAPGLVSSSVGTSGVLFAHTEGFDPDPSGRLHAFCHAVPGAYHLMAVTPLGRRVPLLVARHFRRGLDDMVGAASEIPPGSEGLVFLPYLSGSGRRTLTPGRGGPSSASPAATASPT